MKPESRRQESGVRSQEHTQTTAASALRSAARLAALALLFLTSDFCLLSSAFPATHVTASYDLGADPKVMATVNGTPQYALVFVQRNKPVSYNGVQYGTTTIQGYLNAAGHLNDGAGNAWLDLVPNPAATPADSYYVVTVNIQGHVHSEIWVVPDVPTIGADLCRQAQAPSATGPTLFYQFLQKDGMALTQRSTLNLLGSGVACSDNAAQLRTECTLTGGSGSAPLATPTTSGTVKTDATAIDPVVYLKSSSDTLLAGKASTTHAHAESDVSNLLADLAATEQVANKNSANGYAGLDASSKLAGSQIPYGTTAGTAAQGNDSRITGAEQTANKNAANGYAGLNASSKLAASQIQEVISSADLTDFGYKSGSGTTIIGSTISSPSDNQCLIYSGGNWVNGSCAGGSSNHNLLSATHPDTVATSPSLGDLLFANSTPAWTKLAGNTTTTKKFLTQTGNGTVSAAPAWSTLVSGDLPSHTHAESEVANLTTDLANKVPTTRNVGTSSPLAGGGALSADLTLTCATCEITGNKNSANGYAGLTASSKITASQIQEVIASADLTDFADKSGSGTTIIGATIATPASNDVLTWNGSNWVNQAPSGGVNALLDGSNHTDTTAGTVARGDLITGQGATAKWTRLAKGAAGKCLQMDGTATDIIWDSCAAGGGDNISVGGTAASDANFSDTTPAAVEGVNVKWQKDASTPNNISAYVPAAGASATGVVTSSAQTFGGAKTFNGNLNGAVDAKFDTFTLDNANSDLRFSRVSDAYFGTNLQLRSQTSNAGTFWMVTPNGTPTGTASSLIFLRTDNVGSGNEEWLSLLASATSSAYYLSVGNRGTGSLRNLNFRMGSTDVFRLNTDATLGILAGMKWGTDNASDIGASAASRPRTIYAGTSVVAPVIGAGGTPDTNFALTATYNSPATFKAVSTAGLSSTGGAGIQGGTSADPTASGQRLGFYTLGSFGTNAANSVALVGWSAEAWASGAKGAYLTLETTATGSATRSERWRVTSSGDFLAGADNTQDIGASGATRPRTGYFGTSLVAPVVNATTGFRVNGAAASGEALVGDGTNFISGTVASAGLASANKTIEKSINIFSPATSDSNKVQIYFGQAVTITRVACSTDTGTATIQLDERAEATPNTAGTDVMTGTLACDTDSQVTTSFSNAGIAADVPLNLQITATGSSPGVVRIHVKATID